MSYETWHDYGFGVNISDIKTTPVQIAAFISMAPEVCKRIEEQMKDWDFKAGQKTLRDAAIYEPKKFEEFIEDVECCTGWRGIGSIAADVINELEKTTVFVSSEDYENTQYVIYMPQYPWNLSDYEKALTQDGVTEIFRKYLSVLTATEDNDGRKAIVVEYQSIENGG